MIEREIRSGGIIMFQSCKGHEQAHGDGAEDQRGNHPLRKRESSRVALGATTCRAGAKSTAHFATPPFARIVTVWRVELRLFGAPVKLTVQITFIALSVSSD